MSWDLASVYPLDLHAWSDGYVVDTPYFEPLTLEVCPAWLSMTAVLHGQPPIPATAPLTWLDLGPGSGLSACMVAAANPNVEVWGCDYNPAHVERARGLATRAGLSNCSFDELPFEAVAADDRFGPGQADVIVVHGVYSWVAPAAQRQIVGIIRNRLRPGGLAYVSYEVATGWSAMVPVAEAMRLHVAADARRSDLAFPDALAAMTQLAEGGARYFPLPAHEASQMTSAAKANPFYAAHEYLGANFRPLMFDEVVDAMAMAKCSYLGSIETTDHATGFWVPPEFAELIAETPDETIRQMLRDVIVQRPLRRDVFRRGLAIPSAIQQEAWLREVSVVGLGKAFTETPVGVPGGEVTLDPNYHAPLVEALVSGPLDVARVLEIHSDWGLPDASTALGLLVAGGYAGPAVATPVNSDARAGARRLSEVLIAENALGEDHGALISPVTGAAVASEFVEMMTVAATWNGEVRVVATLADSVQGELTRQGRALIEDGEFVTDESKARELIERRVAGALERIDGAFVGLGIS